MFGFLKGHSADRAYRQVYAGCCAFQHAIAGADSLVFLSYEAILLYLLAVDAGICERPCDAAVTCCRLRKRRADVYRVDPRGGEFCVNFGLLLASIKLDDDVRDERSVCAALARRWFAARFRAARKYFSRIDSDFLAQSRAAIADHLERERVLGPQSLSCYAEPTSRAFGTTFRLFAHHLAGSNQAEAAETFERIGRDVGTAMIAYDCAVDWHTDRRRGRYNPLRGPDEVIAAFTTTQQALSRAGWHCRDAFDTSSLAAGVFASMLQRVARRGASAECSPLLARQRIPLRLVRTGDCDCPCEPSCCDGGCCDAGADGPGIGGHGCGDCAGSRFFVCDCCCDPACCEWYTRRKDGRSDESEQGLVAGDASDSSTANASLIGMTGHAKSPLNPTGVIVVAGKTLPARSQGEWIDAGTTLEVIAADRFGVTVRPAKPPMGP